MNSSAPQEFEFSPIEESDFPTLTAWLQAPHACRFYQKTPVTLEEVALKYGPLRPRRGADYLPSGGQRGVPFAYLQCYRMPTARSGSTSSS